MSPGHESDGDLLERFLAQCDEAAFAALVRRHGSLVYGVCRRVLGDETDAEDAFQATFLILFRRAAALGKPTSIRSWLYTVAVRVAQRARASAACRRLHERRAVVPTEKTDTTEASDLRQVLDEELCRLPEKYRAALLLCYLDGKTNDEAAAELGCPVGTIWTRLSRGRDLLHERLVRRGLTLSLAAVTAVLGETTQAAVPLGLADATVKAVSLCARGETVAVAGFSGNVLTLTDGVLRAMWLARVRTAALVALALLVSVGATWAIHHAAERTPAEPSAQRPDELREAELPEAAAGNVALATNGTAVYGIEHGAIHLNDGSVSGLQRHANGRCPCQWTIELPRAYPLTMVRLLLWDGTDRYYQYELEASADGEHYEVLADRSTGKWRSWQTITFPARPVKFLRINGLYNSENTYFHLKELEAYCLPPADSVTPAFPSEP